MFVVVTVQVNTGGTSTDNVQAKSDAGNPPTTVVAEAGTAYTGLSSNITPIPFIVLPGNYYELVANLGGGGSASIVSWVEWN